MAAHTAAGNDPCAGQVVAAPAPLPQHSSGCCVEAAGLPQAAEEEATLDRAGSCHSSTDFSLRAASSAEVGSSSIAAASNGVPRPTPSCGGGCASEHALPATPRLRWDTRRLLSAAMAPAAAPPDLSTPCTPRPQPAAAGAGSEEPSTPCSGRYRFGDPFSPLRKATPSAPLPGRLDGGSVRCSARVSTPAAPLAWPPQAALPPPFLRAMRPCSVKLTGSVRLVGQKIIPLRGPESAAARCKPAPPVPAQGVCSQREAAAWRREPSFADLLATQHGAARHGAERGGSSPPLAAPTLPPAVLPAAPSADDLPIGVAAEMATSPRKRARKRRVPVRSDTGDATLAAAQLAPLQGSSGSSSACAPGERPDGPADPFEDGSEADGAHSGPRKAPRLH
ncbi:hypothetical protein ABPG77_004143 [Micractinium sp. CCAP 211/92]